MTIDNPIETSLPSFQQKQMTDQIQFPSQDLLPKSETKSDKFPFDGTGITVGILDTGVDPGAFGLSICPDQTQKIIHIADCTGAGDVSMDIVAEAFVDETRNGSWVIRAAALDIPMKDIILSPHLVLHPFPDTELTKKTLISSNEASSPVRIGWKRGYDLYPKQLKERVMNHYQDQWNNEHHNIAVPLYQQLARWKEKFSLSKPTADDLREKEEMIARLDLLHGKGLVEGDLLKEDPGPLYLLVLYYDGENYRVIMDEYQDGDLSHISIGMTDFHKEYEFKRFSNVDMLNYCFNIHNDGQIVSIVCDAGAHGTHVAGIVGRFQEGENETNGVAPGVKIVALKIGDCRLGSMETGSALTRAMIEAVKHKCDIINLSYGEGCAVPNRGRFVELAEELVLKHGIVFVASAGNNGPALSTVGAPGGTSDAILGVAAYVSPSMMISEYSMSPILDKGSGIEVNSGTTYTWSSVGPTADGAIGVDITAPGAAITCVPNWTLQKSQLMNGTSMSSPNAAGCIALLLSAAKADGLRISPTRCKRALVNAAEPIPGLSHLQQGAGMINVEAAWKYIKDNIDDPYEDIHLKTKILNRNGDRGVYLRQPKETNERQTFSVEINPIFSTKENVELSVQLNRVACEMKMYLVTSAAWVHAPEYFYLAHNGRSFKFDVDPTRLEDGLHTATILGYDACKSRSGPRFSIPITVVKPRKEDVQISFGEMEFCPNEVKRFFLAVPVECNWMDVTVRDLRNRDVDNDVSTRMIVLHSVQLLPHEPYRNAESKKYINLLPREESVTSIEVFGGMTCELDLARFWSSQGPTKLDLHVRFRGVISIPNILCLNAGGGGGKVLVRSGIIDEVISPEASLTHWKTVLSPKSPGLVQPCDDRDMLFTNNKQIHQLLLTYEFEMKDAGKVTLRAPFFQGYLYESPFESQMMLIFDEDKRYIGVADSWPSECDIPKGMITIRMQIRHDDTTKLESFLNSPIWIERKLKKEIRLDVFASHDAMVTKGAKWIKTTLTEGSSAAVFFSEPSSVDVPSDCSIGDILFGTFRMVDITTCPPSSGKKPGSNSITYVVGPKVSENKNDSKSLVESDTRTNDEKLKELIRDAKFEHFKAILEDKEVDRTLIMQMYEEFIHDYPNHLSFHLLILRNLDVKEKRTSHFDDIICISNSVISGIDSDKLASFFGQNIDGEDATLCSQKKNYERMKEQLIEALTRKARAYADRKDPTSDEEFRTAIKNLQRWVDLKSDKKFLYLTIEKEKRQSRFASTMQLISPLIVSRGKETLDGIYPLTKDDLVRERINLLNDLGYSSLANREMKWRLIGSSKSYASF